MTNRVRTSSDAEETPGRSGDPRPPAGLRSLPQIVSSGRRLLRLRPFETETAEGRSLERYRRILLSTLGSGTSQFLLIVSTVVIVQVVVRHLGSERYGLLVIITSISALVGFADLGMGGGLVNAISRADGEGDRQAAQRAVASAFFVLVGVALVLGVAFAIVTGIVSWAGVFNVRTEVAASEVEPALAAFMALFLANLPLGVVQRVQMGYQAGYLNSLWQGAGFLLGLAGVLLAVALDAGLVWVVLALAAAPLAASLGNGIVLFGFQRPWLRPSPRRVTRSSARFMLRTGLLFFVLQVAFAVGFESDSLVLARILGPDAVSEYAVPAKLFLFVPTILGFVLVPLWPAYGESVARRDVRWARRALRRSLVLAVAVSVPLSAVLVVWGRPIVHLWVGEGFPTSAMLFLALGAWNVVMSVSVALSMFLNGTNVIRLQAGLAVVMMLANLGLSIVLTHLVGVSGVVWGSVVAQVLVILLPLSLFVPRHLRRLAEGPAQDRSVVGASPAVPVVGAP